MPLLTVYASVRLNQPQALVQQLSRFTAELLGKSESYVMIHIQDNQRMGFAGNDAPCALMVLESLDLPQDKTPDYSSRLCEYASQQLEIPTNRIYIKFSSPERHLWGWDGRTFG